jgi:hypothetical protein
MKTTMWDNESVRVNRLYVVMAQMHRQNIFMSVTDNQVICDVLVDKQRGYIKERKAYEFDENDLLIGVIEWEQEDIEKENQYMEFMRGDQEE